MPAAVETMMSVREVPWHRLGTVLADYPKTTEEALAASGLDWTVEKRPVYYSTETGEFTEYPGSVLVVRTSDEKPLGVVGPRFEFVQNEQMFDFLQALVDGGMLIETAGSLRGGGLVWALGKLPENVFVGGDEIAPYVLVANGHDGWNSFSARTTPIRVVCQNTFNLALSNTISKWTIRHTGDPVQKLDEARLTLDLGFEYYDSFAEEVERLIDDTITEQRFTSIVAKLIPKGVTDRSEELRDAKRDEIRDVYHNSKTVANYLGTAWGFLNAVSEYELWTPTQSKRDHYEVQSERIFAGEATPMTTKAHRMLVAARKR